MTDDLELRLNRAAEAASPEAQAVFWQAIDEMTMDDVREIFDGPDTRQPATWNAPCRRHW